MNGTTYRKLTESEIGILKDNGCSSPDWMGIEVSEDFLPDYIQNCRFSGTVRLGKNVRIDTVREGIENYEIGDNAVILHTESLVCNPGSTFGNGVNVAVLNESGGREVPIYNGLNAQIAYLCAMYRHHQEAVKAIEELIEKEIRQTVPELGQIGPGSYIAHCGALTDICTGENAVLKGVAELTNGTVNSTPESPTTIGRGVIARDFIVADSTKITDFVQLEKCFVGQGCHIGKGFTAQNSLFFADCECEQGEACAVFAGPYTVTHHKSTLLIGGMFSFYNAGSNSNQSNHMYRLGPIHQGILERGCKTGSGSYLLFPARIGVFSVVKGRHYGNPDTAHLPFSYLIEENGKTILLPGANLRSIGLARDTRKWPERDKRKGEKHDAIVFDALNPNTMEEIYTGWEMLNRQQQAPGIQFPDPKLEIPPRQVERGRENYRTALDLWIGDHVLRRITAQKKLTGNGDHPQWSDMAGLIAPSSKIKRLLENLPSLHSIHELRLALQALFEHYEEWAWEYTVTLLERIYGKKTASFTPSDWTEVIQSGTTASEKFLRWQTTDAAKEYADAMRRSYGMNGDDPERDQEFTAIHRDLESNAILQKLEQEHKERMAHAEEAYRLL